MLLKRGKSWLKTFLPIAQLYHVTTDNNIPYNLLTNRQDGPSMKGPSRSRTENWWHSGMIQSGMWREIGGGESGFATPDPVNPDIVWSSASGSGSLGGIVTRYNEKTKQYRQLEVWPEYAAGSYASLTGANLIIDTTEIYIVVVNPLSKNFRFVNPSTLLGDKINQPNS